MIRRPGWVATGAAVIGCAAILAVDTLAPPAVAPPPPVADTADVVPVGGAVTCALADDLAGVATSLTVASADPARSRVATVELGQLADGVVDASTLPQVLPGSAARATFSSGALGAAHARWQGAPVVLHREWVVDGAEELPDVTVAGPCPAAVSTRWVVPGLSTSGGDEARLRLANPARAAATVAVGFLTPEGPESPLILRNVSVPPRSVREVVVNESMPERADLAAVVEVASGRVVVEGLQLSRSAIGGIDGGSLLAAAPAPQEEWTVPWARDDGDASSWLWLANPTDRTAEVELSLHTPDGGVVPDGLATTTVTPGTVQRVDLSGTFPEDVEVAAVTARSNGTPIVVSGGTTITATTPARTATVVQLGAPSPDVSWTLAGAGAAGRAEALHLVNPTGEAAEVRVELLVGDTRSNPEELQQLRVGPGASVVVALDEHLDGAASWVATVRAMSGAVVAGRVSLVAAPGDGDEPDPDGETADLPPLRMVATVGTPSAAWRATPAPLVAVAREGLANDLRTDAGVRPTDPLDPLG